ncbi:1722_t:CDS:2 [Funneliformis mosseae]|uniref:1722_t:CDS:1 n=1 Tax=Funneliformis mosseae TaxID=27381 RepID=A0A9N9BMM8_FUNMO|nr:1722_t:CDS:2 [Funneliformis mosseae]
MSYSSVTSEPENATTIDSKRGLDTHTSPLTGGQRSRSDLKRHSLFNNNSNSINPEKPQHIKIGLPFNSQLSKNLNNEQELYGSHNRKTINEIWEMAWVEKDKFSKKFWFVFVITLLTFFVLTLSGFVIYLYYTNED